MSENGGIADNGGMSCKELVELVTDYFEGALPADDPAHFDAHLALCPAVRRVRRADRAHRRGRRRHVARRRGHAAGGRAAARLP